MHIMTWNVPGKRLATVNGQNKKVLRIKQADDLLILRESLFSFTVMVGILWPIIKIFSMAWPILDTFYSCVINYSPIIKTQNGVGVVLYKSVSDDM